MSGYRTIRELIAAQVGTADNPVTPQATALLGDGRAPITYRLLLEQVDAIGSYLRAAGVARSDRVAIVIPNGPEMAVAFLGVASAATAAPLNPNFRSAEFDFYMSDLNARALLINEQDANEAIAVAQSRQIPVIRMAVDASFDRGVRFAGGYDAAGAPPVAAASERDVALILHTSGTTARPKMVPLSHGNLCASAQNIRDWLSLGPNDRCLNIMPLFHIHGLASALLASLAGGGSIACMPGPVEAEFFRWMRAMRPTWYTAVPTMHQAILAAAAREPDPATAAPLRFVRSCSSALPPQVGAALERTFGVPVIEAYGMTESTQQMCSNPLPPGQRKFGTVGLPAGTRIAILGDAGQLLAAGETGEVIVQGATVMAGYVDNAEANVQAFRDGWFRTGDVGSVDADGYLRLSGRIKEIINRGGEKISPREVDEVLLDHPAVAGAVTFGMPHARLGEEVAAAVVLRGGVAAPTEIELMTFVGSRLADFKVPRRIVFVEELPKGPTGKLQRIGLARRLGLERAASRGAPDARRQAQTLEEAALVQIWQDVLRVDDVWVSDRFFELGGDSILAAQVLARIREQLGTDLSMLVFYQSPRLSDMAAAIARAPARVDQASGMDPQQLEAMLAEIESMDAQQAMAQLQRVNNQSADAGPAQVRDDGTNR